MGFSCRLCSPAARRGEREWEDAQKPEPGVFVSECVSADVNSVPLWRRRCLWRGNSPLVCPTPPPLPLPVLPQLRAQEEAGVGSLSMRGVLVLIAVMRVENKRGVKKKKREKTTGFKRACRLVFEQQEWKMRAKAKRGGWERGVGGGREIDKEKRWSAESGGERKRQGWCGGGQIHEGGG